METTTRNQETEIHQSVKKYLALDIGTTKIVALIGSLTEHNKIKVDGMGHTKSDGVRDGVVHNILLTTKSIQEAVKMAIQEADYKTKEVVVGIAGEHIRSRNISYSRTREDRDAEITEKDLKKLEEDALKTPMSEGDEIIHIVPQEYKVDGKSGIENPIGMGGFQIEANFHVIIAKIAAIRNIAKCVHLAGLELAGITLESFASSKSVLYPEEVEAGVVLLDIGGGTSDLAIFKNKIIRYSSVIPFGADCITKDLKDEFQLLNETAESLKINFGYAIPDDKFREINIQIKGIAGRSDKQINQYTLSKLIKLRIKDIMHSFSKEIKRYNAENSDKKNALMVITGGGSSMKDIAKLVEMETGFEVRIGNPNQYLTGDESSKRIKENPIYSTAVGLLIEAIENGSNSFQNQIGKIVSTDKVFKSNIPSSPIEEDKSIQINKNIYKKRKNTFNQFTEIFGAFKGKLVSGLMDNIKEFLKNS